MLDNKTAEQKLREFLRSGDTLPSGPCSAWPRGRNKQARDILKAEATSQLTKPRVKAGIGQQIKNLGTSAKQAVQFGKVSAEIRDERFETCKGCPSLIQGTERCSECGCFMAAKTWLAADPAKLCPLQKWAR